MATNIWQGDTDTAWSTAGNWDTGSAPASSSDSAIFNQTATGSVAGSDQSAATLDLLQITSTFSSYSFGDLATPLKVKATLVKIGEPSNSATVGSHSGRINWDGSTAASTIIVYGTKTSSTDTGLEPVRLKAVNASNALVVYAGRVGVATNSSADVATFTSIALLSSSAYVNIASGVTLTTLRMEGGTANLNCAATTVQNDAGSVTTYGTGAITTANVSGTADLRSTGTVTTCNVFGGGTLTLLNDSRAKTISTLNLYKGATVSYDPSVHTISTFNLLGCLPTEVTINVPRKSTRVVTFA